MPPLILTIYNLVYIYYIYTRLTAFAKKKSIIHPTIKILCLRWVQMHLRGANVSICCATNPLHTLATYPIALQSINYPRFLLL